MELFSCRHSVYSVLTRYNNQGSHAYMCLPRSEDRRLIRESLQCLGSMLVYLHRYLRLTFAREHSACVDWSSVLWIDESRFTTLQSDGPTFVGWRHGEQLRDDCVVPTSKFGGGGTMIMGTMSYRGTGLHIFFTGNCRWIHLYFWQKCCKSACMLLTKYIIQCFVTRCIICMLYI